MTTIPDPSPELDPTTLAGLLDTLAASAPRLADTAPDDRARALRAVADALDAAVDGLVALAHDETGLPLPRLTGEVARTTGQLRLFASELDEGSWLDVIIDTADPDAQPVPRPDLRRMQVAAGPVVVFAASNFPFAFSVAGGDTASALAAGCPVVVKAHPGHPATSRRTAEIVASAWASAGMPAGSFALVEGERTGVEALRHPAIAAGAFTGSERGGTALARIAAERETPIPFYAEMGSINPVFVTPGAVAARGDEIVDGYVGSFTLGVGQFCTKPGLLFLPQGHGLDDRLAVAVHAVAPGRMLVARIAEASRDGQAALAEVPGVRTIATVPPGDESGLLGGALLVATDLATLLDHRAELLSECFGPTSVVVEYDDQAAAVEAASALTGSLTATIHAEDDEAAAVAPLVRVLRDRAGRLVWNGWPTGVAVSRAMHHGGPFPATTLSAHTSVGGTAIRRFHRPVVYQDYPAALLPSALQDDNPLGLLRRVDGEFTRGAVGADGS
ncbi:MAG: aldehyde dehydrogenase (NADP(+)) [Actinomycetota bacterium]|nr:aldehyde dehydrogenase (NADP(+)) [Actinomycetota bacterium]